MAQVDFSNARLVLQNPSLQTLYFKKIGLVDYNFVNSTTKNFLTDPSVSPTEIVGTATITLINDTPGKYSLAFVGNFIKSGNTIWWETRTDYYNYQFVWKITNISFSAGDTFSFIIDVDVEGS